MRISPLRRLIGLAEVCGVVVGWSAHLVSLGVGVALVGVGPGVLGAGVEVGLLVLCLTASKWMVSS